MSEELAEELLYSLYFQYFGYLENLKVDFLPIIKEDYISSSFISIT